MITAQSARKLAYEAYAKEINFIIDEIVSRAKAGYFRMSFAEIDVPDGYEISLTEPVLKAIEELGYELLRDHRGKCIGLRWYD